MGDVSTRTQRGPQWLPGWLTATSLNELRTM